MTATERAAAEVALNSLIGHIVVVVVIGWWLWWAWQRLNIPPFPWHALQKAFTPAPIPNVTEVVETPQTEQTDQQTDRVSAVPIDPSPLQLDRTRRAVVKVLVQEGWSVGEIRAVVKGDNGAIGAEVESVRAELGMAPPEPRTLRVKDQQGERTIAM